MSSATAWRLCALAGFATLLASTAFGWIPGLKACGPTGGASAIIAFELARTPATLAALFGSEPCTSTLLAAQRSALWLDELGFIPAYTAFLALGAWALRDASKLAIITVAVFLIAGLCDEIEGVTMFALMNPLPGEPWLFTPLFWAVHIKFALLGVGDLLLAAALARGTWLGRIAAVPVLGGGLVALWILFTAAHDPLLVKAQSYAWAALLLAAIVASIRPSLVKRPIPA